MPSEFSNVDFKFRYGYRSTIHNTAVKNGSINIAKDFGEVYIDISDIRIPINDIYFFNNEYEIRGVENPISGKLYFAKDIRRFMAYDTEEEEWKFVTHSYEELEEILNNINSFELLVSSSLPSTGKSHTIYFVPESNSDEDTVYDEFIWIDSEERFEKIGISKADLGNYYTKDETDEKFATALSMSQEDYDTGTSESSMMISPKLLKDIISAATAGTTTDSNIQNIESNISGLQDDVSTITGNISSINSDISDINTSISGITGDVSGINTRVSALELIIDCSDEDDEEE